MRLMKRFVMFSAVMLSFTLPMAGCGNENEKSMAGTKGTAAPDAPKSQAEFFNQQKSMIKSPSAKTAQHK